MGEETVQEKESRDELDLSLYGVGPDCNPATEFVERRLKPQKPRKGVEDYWVWLSTAALGLSIHRPVTKLLAYLFLEATFEKSRTVKVSFQRAKRFLNIGCSRKTFYRAINELECAGFIITKRETGKNIEATIQQPFAKEDWTD